MYGCIDEHFGLFHLLVTVDSAVMNMYVHVFEYLFSEFIWSFCNSMFNFSKNHQNVFHSVCAFHIPTSNA